MRFLRKEARLSQYFNVVGSSFQTMGAATEKTRLPRFSLVLGIESCCEVDKGKGKGSFYIAQYPIRRTAQSALHYLPSLADLFIVIVIVIPFICP